jgi:uncharacterized membrane protein
MSTSSSPTAGSDASSGLGAAEGRGFGMSIAGDGSVVWVLKRNCSITPRQSLAAYGGLCVLLMGVAGLCWANGAELVMPFAWLELLAVGAAFCVYARHATDRELISLRDGRLIVERHSHDSCIGRVDFALESVRVQPHAGERALIELTGEGKKATVGRYVRPELRPVLADELRSVLRTGQLPPKTRQSELNLKL